MDDPIISKGLEYHEPHGYSDNYYDNYNRSEYGSFLNIDTQTGYLMIGLLFYVSCCCFRGLNRSERDTDLNIRLTQEIVVSPRVVEKIKTNTVDPNILAKDSCCSICLEDFDNTKNNVYLDCQHIYHEDCIIEWINKDPSCPLCRSNSLV
jgi:hypothetical protein